MALKYFVIVALGFLAASVVFFVRLNDFSKEAWIVYFTATGLIVLALAWFVQKNRRSLSAITREPSERNVETFISLLTGRNRRSKEGTDRK